MNQLKQLIGKTTLAAAAAGFLAVSLNNAMASDSCPSNKNCCYWPDGTLAGAFLAGTCCCITEVTGDVGGAKKFLIGGQIKYYKLISYSCATPPEDC